MPNDQSCMLCDNPAVWIRSTQFAGDHPFCENHAKLESDFGQSDSYAYWINLKEPERTITKLSKRCIKEM
jgi:hypothetical protein